MEIWKDVKGYEGKYLISSTGRVMSCERCASDGRKIKQKILNPTRGKCPYLSVMLVGNGKNKRVYIHRMVAESFVDNKTRGRVVNHIDGNKLNNYPINLEWCSSKQNNEHAIKTGLMVKTRHPLQASRDDGYGLFFPSIHSAISHGFTSALIWAVLQNKQNTHKGFKWQSLRK